jgi:hypothetical protein
MPPTLIEDLYRRAATFARKQGTGDSKEKRIASAKRKYELELRARGVSRSQAKIAVAVRFNGGKL